VTESFHTRLADDGRVVIPAPLRHQLGLKPGDHVVIDAEADGLRLRSYAKVLEEVQGYFRQFVKPGVSLVDKLIAERRAEAKREEAELVAWVKAHPRNPRE
jgi:AbrB family looped-hinge helix DNA binding protein